MKVRIRLSFRVLLLVFGTVTLAVIVAAKSINGQFRSSIVKSMSERDAALLGNMATSINNIFGQECQKLLTMKTVIESTLDSDFNTNEEFYKTTIKDMCESDKKLAFAWLFLDSESVTDSGIEGRYKIKATKNSFSTDVSTEFVEPDMYVSTDVYDDVNGVSVAYLAEPDFFNFDDDATKRSMKVTLAVPVEKNGDFAGVLGVDIILADFRLGMDSISLDGYQRIAILSARNLIIDYTETDLIGQDFGEIDSLLSKVDSSSSFVLKSIGGIDSTYNTIMVVNPADLDNSWKLLVCTTADEVEDQIDNSLTFVSKVIILGLIVLALLVFGISVKIVSPIKKVNSIINKLSLGQVDESLKMVVASNDELGQMADSSNKVVEGLLQVTKFAENIGNGNSSYKFTPLSDKDVLGNAIIEMKNSLDKAKEEETQRREEEGQLNWASSGINLFNKVLRVDNDDMKLLAGEIIRTLTTYVDSQMGAFYVVPNDREGVEMIAHIGFDKDKVISNSYVAPGDGLIGRAYLEKETIFISEIPADMDKIGSGLGKALPKSALVVPLIYNKALTGIIELYSFKVLQQYQIAFVEKLSENIASTISTVKINGQTAELLEKSKRQSEVLEQQEEEIRQNMEEMQASQEESTQKEKDLSAKLESLCSILPMVHYDKNQCITEVNDEYLKLMKTKKEKLIGKRHKSERFMDEEEQIKHDKFWSELFMGNIMEYEEQIADGKEPLWVMNRFIPVCNGSNDVAEVICLVIDISNQKKLESQIQMVQEGVIPDGINSEIGKENKEIRQRLIDLTNLNVVYKNDDKKIYTILKRYSEQIPGQISDIEKSIKTRNYKVLKMEAKALKTKINYLGIKPIYDALDSIIDLIATDMDLTSIPDIFNNIKINWSVASEELSEILGTEA